MMRRLLWTSALLLVATTVRAQTGFPKLTANQRALQACVVAEYRREGSDHALFSADAELHCASQVRAVYDECIEADADPSSLAEACSKDTTTYTDFFVLTARTVR